MPRPSREELVRAGLTLNTCALRFDGYRYAERTVLAGDDAMAVLVNLQKSLAATMVMPFVVEDAFAAIFACQSRARVAGWFPDRSDISLLGLLLYLHLYQRSTPEPWRFLPYADAWEQIPTETREATAAIVRRWLAHADSPVV